MICLTVKDKRPRQKNRRWNVDIKCLMCHALIEKAAANIPSETKTKTKTYTKKTVAPKPEEQTVLPSREVETQPKAPVIPEEDEANPLVGEKEKMADADTSATAGLVDHPAVTKPNGESTTEPPPSA
jgi:hypothetical protein